MNQLYQFSDEKDKGNKLRIGRISYINVDPVYYQFDHEQMPENMQMISRVPAVLNKMLADKELDISSVSAAAFARHSDQWMILPDLSISCYGKVLSVLLVSRYPLEELQNQSVLLTDESATAVDLLKLIFSLKGIFPAFQTGKVKEPADLGNDSPAGLVIGDAALKHQWSDSFEYVYDLCEIWNEMTGLPFVFAVWAVRKSYAQKFPHRVLTALEKLKTSKELGLRHLADIVRLASKKINIDPELCQTYYNSMYYSMSQPEVQCLQTFFSRLHASGIIDQKPELHFFNPIDAYQAMGI